MNSRPEKPSAEFLRRDLGAGSQAVGDGPARQTDQAVAVGVVHVDDASVGSARAGAFEQAALGGEIILEGVVKIEMVAGEIGEDGGGEMATPQRDRAPARGSWLPARRACRRRRTTSARKPCRSSDSGVVVVAGRVACGVR